MGFLSGLTNFISDPVGSIGNLFSGSSGSSGSGVSVDPWSAALNVAGNIGSTVLSDYYSRQAASRNYGYTKSLIDYQNDYNTPLAQRRRLEEAGYNPNLFYNTGANTSASGSVSVHPAKVTPIDLLGAYNLSAQNALLNEQTANTAMMSLMNGRRANIAWYNEQYAKKEYEIFKKTGKIPETYLKSQWQGELTGLIKGFLEKIL